MASVQLMPAIVTGAPRSNSSIKQKLYLITIGSTSLPLATRGMVGVRVFLSTIQKQQGTGNGQQVIGGSLTRWRLRDKVRQGGLSFPTDISQEKRHSEIAVKNAQLKARLCESHIKRSHPATSVETLRNDTDRVRHCTEAFSTYANQVLIKFLALRAG